MKVDQEALKAINSALLKRCTERVEWFGVVDAKEIAASVIDEVLRTVKAEMKAAVKK